MFQKMSTVAKVTKNILERDNSFDYPSKKLGQKVKQIVVLRKAVLFSDEIRKTKLIIEKARAYATNRLSNRQLEDDESSDISRFNRNAQKERFVRPKLEVY